MKHYEEPELLEEENEEPELELTRQERRWLIFGVLRTALLIGSIYLIGAALLIWLILFIAK